MMILPFNNFDNFNLPNNPIADNSGGSPDDFSALFNGLTSVPVPWNPSYPETFGEPEGGDNPPDPAIVSQKALAEENQVDESSAAPANAEAESGESKGIEPNSMANLLPFFRQESKPSAKPGDELPFITDFSPKEPEVKTTEDGLPFVTDGRFEAKKPEIKAGVKESGEIGNPEDNGSSNFEKTKVSESGSGLLQDGFYEPNVPEGPGVFYPEKKLKEYYNQLKMATEQRPEPQKIKTSPVARENGVSVEDDPPSGVPVVEEVENILEIPAIEPAVEPLPEGEAEPILNLDFEPEKIKNQFSTEDSVESNETPQKFEVFHKTEADKLAQNFSGTENFPEKQAVRKNAIFEALSRFFPEKFDEVSEPNRGLPENLEKPESPSSRAELSEYHEKLFGTFKFIPPTDVKTEPEVKVSAPAIEETDQPETRKTEAVEDDPGFCMDPNDVDNQNIEKPREGNQFQTINIEKFQELIRRRYAPLSPEARAQRRDLEKLEMPINTTAEQLKRPEGNLVEVNIRNERPSVWKNGKFHFPEEVEEGKKQVPVFDRLYQTVDQNEASETVFQTKRPAGQLSGLYDRVAFLINKESGELIRKDGRNEEIKPHLNGFVSPDPTKAEADVLSAENTETLNKTTPDPFSGKNLFPEGLNPTVGNFQQNVKSFERKKRGDNIPEIDENPTFKSEVEVTGRMGLFAETVSGKWAEKKDITSALPVNREGAVFDLPIPKPKDPLFKSEGFKGVDFENFIKTVSPEKEIEIREKEIPFSETDVIGQLEPRIIELAEFAEKTGDKKSVKMRLHPEELGEVEVNLETRSNGEIRAHIHTDKESAHKILADNLEHLRENLQNNGWQVEKLEVSCNPFSSGQQNTGENSSRENQTVPNQRNFNSDADRTTQPSDDPVEKTVNRLVNLRA